MKKPYLLAAILFLIALFFYLLTLQPSLAWGDGIRLQREAVTAESYILAEMVDVPFAADPFPYARVGVAAWDHPLYVMLGNSLVCVFPDATAQCWFSSPLPPLHALWLVNLISAVFGAGTIALLFLLSYRHTQSAAASLLAALALAISHTFWWHAVTPEVYTLFTFLLILTVYWFDSYERSGRFIFLFGTAFALGLGIANHLLAALAIPAFILYLIMARKMRPFYALKWPQVVWAIAAFLMGLAPYWVQFLRMLRTFPLNEILGPAAGTAFLQGSLALAPTDLLQSVTSYLIFLFYQFLPTGVLIGLYGWWAGRHPYSALWKKAAAFYLVYLLFGLVYRVSDQFAFFLGAHLFWAVAIALGIARLEAQVWPTQRRVLLAALALPILVTPLLYDMAPSLFAAVGITQEEFGIPQIGTGQRDGLDYYLNPNKWGDMEAYNFGQKTLDALPDDAVVIAQYYTDTDEYFIFRYFAAVHGRHPNMTVFGWPTGDPFSFDAASVRQVLEEFLPSRPVYLASLSAEFYDAPALLRDYCIVVEGNLYRVHEQASAADQPCLPPATDFLEP